MFSKQTHMAKNFVARKGRVTALKTKSLVARDTMKGVVTWYRVLQNPRHGHTLFEIQNGINIEGDDPVSHFE